MLIHSYGLFWRRSDVYWGKQKSAGKLLGRGKNSARPVDFASQTGTYVLYDDNFRMVYAGQAKAANMGLLSRLRSHTRDQLADRWSKFSWFGVRRVNNDGNLASLAAYKTAKVSSVIDHIEAILITAAEPPHNRQGGRFGTGVKQYFQLRDDRLGLPDSELLRKLAPEYRGRTPRILPVIFALFGLAQLARPECAPIRPATVSPERVSLSKLQQDAAAGDARAQYQLSRSYYSGENVPKNDTLALEWLEKASSKGYPPAQEVLAQFFLQGTVVMKDTRRAEALYLAAAEQGNSEAQVALGTLYATGSLLRKDSTRAAKWLSAALPKGHPLAQYNLGLLYLKGEGVRKDPSTAVDLWKKAALQGCHSAQIGLARVFAKGDGIRKDPFAAYLWANVAASSGDSESTNFRDSLMKLLSPNQRDDAQMASLDSARAFLSETHAGTVLKKAEDSDPEAQFQLGKMLANGDGIPQVFSAAYQWINLAASQGHANAAEARRVLEARLTPAQVAEGQRLSRQWDWAKTSISRDSRVTDELESATLGTAGAQYNLGQRYYIGNRVPKDLVLAYVWTNLAAAQGHVEARNSRSGMEKQMTPEQVREAQQLSTDWHEKMGSVLNRGRP